MTMQMPTARLSEILEPLEAGVSVNSEDRVAREDEPGVLKVSAVADGRFLPLENKAIVDPRERSRVVANVHAGDILISRANTLALVGSCGLALRTHENLFLSDKIWRTRPIDPARDDPRWLIGMLNSPIVRAAIRSRATGTSGSMKNISQGSFLQIVIPRPPMAIQTKVGEFLEHTSMAEAILESLENRKQQFRRAVVELLARDSLAGGSSWDLVPISTVATELKLANTANDVLPVLSCTKHRGLVLASEFFSKRIHSTDLSKYKVVKRGDYVYATNHIEEGSIGLQYDFQHALVSPMYTVFRTDASRVDDRFFLRVLKSESYRRRFEAATNRTVNRRGSLRWKEFSKITVPLPPLSEQHRIAGVLDLLDVDLYLIQRLRTLLDKQKRAVVHRLVAREAPFTGHN